MPKPLYTVTRDLHLYLGLFISPFIVLFSLTVFFLVHGWLPHPGDAAPRTVSGVPLPANLESLDGRARVDALRTVLPALGVQGEIGFVRHSPKQRRVAFSVSVPGRETTVDLDIAARTALVSRRDSGIWDGLILLHKSPGQHLVNIRMNWFPMRVWRWFADATVYLLLFITVSGIYMWTVLRSERRAGLAFLAAGAFSFTGIVYAVIR